MAPAFGAPSAPTTLSEVPSFTSADTERRHFRPGQPSSATIPDNLKRRIGSRGSCRCGRVHFGAGKASVEESNPAIVDAPGN